MTALLIVLSVTTLILLLLFLPIRLRISYTDELRVSLSLFGIPFSLHPRKKKTRIRYYSKKSMQRRKDKARKKALRAAKKQPKTPPPPPAPPKKKTVSDYMRTVKVILFIIKRVQKRARGGFRLHISEFSALVATSDAASTALLYGAVSQACSYILALSEGFIKTTYKAENIAIVPDFCGTETKFRIRISLKSDIRHLILVGLSTLFAHLSSKKQENLQ